MVFFSDQVIFGQGLEEVEPPAIGESARLLIGAPDGVPLSVLYAQDGPIMYRIGGSTSSPDGDPTADVLAVAGADHPGPGRRRLIVFNRENAIGLVLLLLCGVVAVVLLFSIVTGTRFRFEGPSWLGTALVILFIGGHDLRLPDPSWTPLALAVEQGHGPGSPGRTIGRHALEAVTA